MRRSYIPLALMMATSGHAAPGSFPFGWTYPGRTRSPITARFGVDYLLSGPAVPCRSDAGVLAAVNSEFVSVTITDNCSASGCGSTIYNNCYLSGYVRFHGFERKAKINRYFDSAQECHAFGGVLVRLLNSGNLRAWSASCLQNSRGPGFVGEFGLAAIP